MLHASTGIQQVNGISSSGSFFTDIRGHQRQNQKQQDYNLQIHEKVVQKLIPKGLGLLVFKQFFPQQIGGDYRILPLRHQQI